MRFRKRVSLGGGSRINLSKSGVSLTTGTRGLSMSFGNKGAYLNTSIPGTGLYDRKKIGGGSRKSNKNFESNEFLQSDNLDKHFPTALRVNISFNDDGTVVLLDPSGHEITDPELVRMIKASPEFKSELMRMNEERMEEYQNRMDDIIRIQEMTPRVYSTEAWKQRIMSMKPGEYTPNVFEDPQPTIDDVIYDLTLEANRTIDVKRKRKRAKLCEEYVEVRKDGEFYNRYTEWQDRKAAFLEQEEERRRKYEEEETKRVRTQQQQFMQLIDGKAEAIDKVIGSWLAKVSFSVDFDIDYEYIDNILLVDLDLPEIEELPDTKAQRMANGTVKNKPKSKKEIKEDYSKCVFGLAVFFAGNLFNKALSVQDIVLSGYTQRRNKAGDIVDDYIYSIIFDRDTFQSLDYKNNDPRGNCMNFKNRVLQNADASFKTIEPYTIENIKQEVRGAMNH